MKEEHLNISVHGRVQGVGYRYYTHSLARELGLKGYVKNQIDGSVYIEVEGDTGKLELFLYRLKEGPSFSAVEKIQKSTGKLKHYKIFSIK